MTKEEEKEQPKFTCKNFDMSDELQAAATDVIKSAFITYSLESEIATIVKKNMNTRFGEIWHCVVGSSFGSSVSHSNGFFIYGDVEYEGLKKSVLLFRTE